MTIQQYFMRFHAWKNMGWFTQNDETEQEDYGEIEKMSGKMKQKLGNLECEEAIIQDKEDFGRVRTNMMKVLRSKHGESIANRALSRVNKRLQENYFGLRDEFF